MSNKKEKKLTPFEQNEENIKIFCENVNLFESALLLVEAMAALNLEYDGHEMTELDRMVKATMKQFSEFMNERGDMWN